MESPYELPGPTVSPRVPGLQQLLVHAGGLGQIFAEGLTGIIGAAEVPRGQAPSPTAGAPKKEAKATEARKFYPSIPKP